MSLEIDDDLSDLIDDDGGRVALSRHRGNVRGTKLHPQPLSMDEVHALIGATGKKSFRGVRARAMIAVMWRGLCRVDEALHLRPADVNLQTGEVRILVGKGSKARTIAIDEKAMGLVADWLAVRGKLQPQPKTPYLFCTKKGQAVLQSYVRSLLPGLARRAGIGKRLHAHGLRHSGACEMRKAGVDIGIISKALGHASIATTARYLDHIAPVDVTKAMRGMTW